MPVWLDRNKVYASIEHSLQTDTSSDIGITRTPLKVTLEKSLTQISLLSE
jgi:hypothetical protein